MGDDRLGAAFACQALRLALGKPLESECPRLWTGSTEELDWFYRKEP